MPWTSTVDMKLDKEFKFVGMNYRAFLEVKNLFDKLNVNNVNDFGSSTRSTYGTWYGNGRESQRDPSNLNPGRNLRLGFEVLW